MEKELGSHLVRFYFIVWTSLTMHALIPALATEGAPPPAKCLQFLHTIATLSQPESSPTISVLSKTEITEDVHQLIERIVWKDDQLGHVLDIRNILRNSPNFIAIVLRVDNKAVGVQILDWMETEVDGKKLQTVYRTYLGIDPDYSGAGYGKLVSKATYDFVEANMSREPGVSFGLISSTNGASRSIQEKNGSVAMHELTAYQLRKDRLSTQATKSPSHPEKLTQLKDEDAAEYLHKLEAAYSDYQMVNFAHSFVPNETYVLRDASGEILIGAQIILRNSAEKESSGEYKPQIFLAINQLYIKKGHEALLPSFLLKSFELYEGVTRIDLATWNEGPLYETLHRAQIPFDEDPVRFTAYMKGYNLPDGFMEKLRRQPIYPHSRLD